MEKNQEPIRRSDVIRCEHCGEDYSVTYKRCPFCDERPNRTDVKGQRVSGNGKSNPMPLISLIISLSLIATAALIIVTTIAPMLSNRKPQEPDVSNPAISAPSSSAPDASTPDSSAPDASSPDSSAQDTPAVNQTVNSIQLNQSDMTLQANEIFTFKVTTDPADATVTWSSSNEAAAKVSANGVVTNVNQSASLVKVTITATAGDKTAKCTIYCKGGSTGISGNNSGTSNSGSSTGGSASGTGKISGASSGLRVRSGPGSSYEAVASLNNGSAVKILEDTGAGWYKISYSGLGGKTETGYVSKDYVTLD